MVQDESIDLCNLFYFANTYLIFWAFIIGLIYVYVGFNSF